MDEGRINVLEVADQKSKVDIDKQFRLTELLSTSSIVRKVVSATEAKNPKLRYVAPWYIALFVRLVRIFGV
jgi:hypothetical protein